MGIGESVKIGRAFASSSHRGSGCYACDVVLPSGRTIRVEMKPYLPSVRVGGDYPGFDDKYEPLIAILPGEYRQDSGVGYAGQTHPVRDQWAWSGVWTRIG